jgi:hypothetical protein
LWAIADFIAKNTQPEQESDQSEYCGFSVLMAAQARRPITMQITTTAPIS